MYLKRFNNYKWMVIAITILMISLKRINCSDLDEVPELCPCLPITTCPRVYGTSLAVSVDIKSISVLQTSYTLHIFPIFVFYFILQKNNFNRMKRIWAEF